MIEMIKGYINKLFCVNVDTKDNNQTNKPIQKDLYEKSNPYEQKELFIDWFKQQTNRGRPYNPVTISGYVGRIEKTCRNPSFCNLQIKNLFEIKNIEHFREVRRLIESNEAYNRINYETHNGFAAALNMYDRFLCSEMSNKTVLNNSFFKESMKHNWTYDENLICCRKYLETYVVYRKDTDINSFVNDLSKELPDISFGSIKMKVQNTKQLCIQNNIIDSLNIKPLTSYSSDNKLAFIEACKEKFITI